MNPSTQPPTYKCALTHFDNEVSNDNSTFSDDDFVEILNREIQHLYTPLIKYVSKRIGNTSAQDILHDAVIVLILKAKDGKLRNMAAIKPFLYSTVGWLIRTYRLRNNKYIATDIDETLNSLVDENYIGNDSKIERAELEQDVMKYIAKLTKRRDQELILHHYWYEKPEAFMERYEVNSDHYSRLLYRAKQRLVKIVNSDRSV